MVPLKGLVFNLKGHQEQITQFPLRDLAFAQWQSTSKGKIGVRLRRVIFPAMLFDESIFAFWISFWVVEF
ncbi:unnamed protein product [Clonostachys solani]|uniref:Uncharacterized protein n=1 Tax=Clonostachys solani TaxID=160281 RepID=A0A9P0E7T6_9HYPO|nr:unnamed protein product [Clonostachys solani]